MAAAARARPQPQRPNRHVTTRKNNLLGRSSSAVPQSTRKRLCGAAYCASRGQGFKTLRQNLVRANFAALLKERTKNQENLKDAKSVRRLYYSSNFSERIHLSHIFSISGIFLLSIATFHFSPNAGSLLSGSLSLSVILVTIVLTGILVA